MYIYIYIYTSLCVRPRGCGLHACILHCFSFFWFASLTLFVLLPMQYPSWTCLLAVHGQLSATNFMSKLPCDCHLLLLRLQPHSVGALRTRRCVDFTQFPWSRGLRTTPSSPSSRTTMRCISFFVVFSRACRPVHSFRESTNYEEAAAGECSTRPWRSLLSCFFGSSQHRVYNPIDATILLPCEDQVFQQISRRAPASYVDHSLAKALH